MDARITKQRLGNMLSYDWLKILLTIAIAALFFGMFFTMIGARPTYGQTFYVYAFDGLSTGGHFGTLGSDMENKSVFGYDILKTGSESFTSGGLYGGTVYNSRRSAGEGRVLFIRDVRTTDDKGNVSSDLLNFLDYEGTSVEQFRFCIDPQKFLQDCREYLEPFFGEDLTGEINNEQARATFLARNGKDARFRTSSKKEKGVNNEVERLKKIRDDYLFVISQMGQTIDYVTYTTEIKTHYIGFSMKQLNLTPLVYYIEEEEGEKRQTNSEIALCIYNNNEREGDLKYESVNFIAYLLRRYGPEVESKA